MPLGHFIGFLPRRRGREGTEEDGSERGKRGRRRRGEEGPPPVGRRGPLEREVVGRDAVERGVHRDTDGRHVEIVKDNGTVIVEALSPVNLHGDCPRGDLGELVGGGGRFFLAIVHEVEVEGEMGGDVSFRVVGEERRVVLKHEALSQHERLVAVLHRHRLRDEAAPGNGRPGEGVVGEAGPEQVFDGRAGHL